ncbi:MAG TPA: (2Fe-2S)-binding protein [Candidatus Angelobacter sp.]|nr:(2Fe-2S)-binding protein [Candidatus Angelobacter sp.]
MPAIILNINGSEHKVDAASGESLLSVLRNRLGLTGTKYGCGEGACGACTVLLQGKAVRSCLAPAKSCAGQKIITVEGLMQDGRLHPVQQAFLEEEAFQCAYCTSGMIMSAVSLLKANAHPSDEQIVDEMNGNICRCGTYQRILAAIRRAVQAEKKEKTP